MTYEVNEPILNSPFDEPFMKLIQPFIELVYPENNILAIAQLKEKEQWKP